MTHTCPSQASTSTPHTVQALCLNRANFARTRHVLLVFSLIDSHGQTMARSLGPIAIVDCLVFAVFDYEQK